MDDFVPLDSTSRRHRSESLVISILINAEGSPPLRVEACKDGSLKISGPGAVTFEPDAAVVERRAADTQWATRIGEIAPSEHRIAEVAAIVEGDLLILQIAVGRFHGSRAPVVVRTNTVAGRGEVTSLSPEGQ